MKQKHLTENNKMIFFCVLLIEAVALLGGIMYRNHLLLPLYIYIIPVAISIGLTAFGRIKYVKEDKGHLFMLCGVALSFLTAMIGLYEIPMIYALTYIICIAIMLYRDLKVLIIGLVTALIANIALTVLSAIYTDNILTVISNDVLVVSAMIIAYAVVARMNRQTNELRDEIETEAKKVKSEAERIKGISLDIKDNINKAGKTVENLSNSVQSSAESVQQISDSTMQTAESVQTQTEMSSAITDELNKVSEKATKMGDNSKDSLSLALDGNKLVKELKNSSENVIEINEKASKLTSELQEQALGIKAVIETILDISNRTNLLSLNASIEAARAGEHGKGFAVVADEIRNLSDNTKESAEEISQVIEELVEKINDASEGMAHTVEVSKEQNELINDTAEKFSTIEQSVEQLNNNSKEVLEYVANSVDANGRIADSISDLSATSEQVAANSESSLAMSNECVNNMQETKELLNNIFELSEQL